MVDTQELEHVWTLVEGGSPIDSSRVFEVLFVRARRFQDLPVNVLSVILEMLPVHDICMLGQVSKEAMQLCSRPKLWKTLLFRDFDVSNNPHIDLGKDKKLDCQSFREEYKVNLQRVQASKVLRIRRAMTKQNLPSGKSVWSRIRSFRSKEM